MNETGIVTKHRMRFSTGKGVEISACAVNTTRTRIQHPFDMFIRKGEIRSSPVYPYCMPLARLLPEGRLYCGDNFSRMLINDG